MIVKQILTIQEYHKSLDANSLAICELLFKQISRALPEATSKVWHSHPVWFLNGNPVVGYAKLKNCVQLLFWSGQSFDEPSLHKEGSFKAAEFCVTSVDQVIVSDLHRWLKKSSTIQWDYKNIVKHRGVLNKIS